MAFGRNDLITRAYAESMINRSNRGLSEQVKSIQEQVVALNIDFAGFHEKLKQLENGNSDTDQRLKNLISAINGYGMLCHVAQGTGETTITARPNKEINGELIEFVANAETLPEAINALIVQFLEYVWTGKQD